MSAWGTGIKQSDEFMDVYDDFYERYKDDATALEVYHAILKEYQEEFPDEDDTPPPVYGILRPGAVPLGVRRAGRVAVADGSGDHRQRGRPAILERAGLGTRTGKEPPTGAGSVLG